MSEVKKCKLFDDIPPLQANLWMQNGLKGGERGIIRGKEWGERGRSPMVGREVLSERGTMGGCEKEGGIRWEVGI